MIARANHQNVVNRQGAERKAGPPLRIGAVASQTGVTVEALRYYERLGLLRPLRRGSSGYREYAADAPEVIRFIRRAQSLGFTLAETADLVRLREAAWSGVATHVLRDAVVAKVEDIDRRIRDLRALRKGLSDHLAACDTACPAVDIATGNPSTENIPTLPAADCPLVQALESPTDPPPKLGRRPGSHTHTPAHVSSRSSRSSRRSS